MKRLLVLGGMGLVAREVAALIGAEYDELVIADIRSTQKKNGCMRYVTLNILEPGALNALITEVKPTTIINGINLATLYSGNGSNGYDQLIQFYVELYKTLIELGAPVRYLHLGTTGSGGLGFNIPFTHGDKVEEYPIIRKAACAGISTALLTMLSRSFPNNMVEVSEVKPGLIIFSDSMSRDTWQGVSLALADGGENGKYTYEELALVTSTMGFTSAKVLAEDIVSVLRGETKQVTVIAHDTVSAMNAAIVSPKPTNEKVLQTMLKELRTARGDTYIIATGDLGPPSLTRDLLLAHGIVYGLSMYTTYEAFLATNISLAKTFEYIESTNKVLATFIKSTSTLTRFAELSDLFSNGDEPWQIVRKMLYKETL